MYQPRDHSERRRLCVCGVCVCVRVCVCVCVSVCVRCLLRMFIVCVLGREDGIERAQKDDVRVAGERESERERER